MAEIETKELAVVKTQATKALGAANDLTIASQEDMVKATDLLSKIKTVGKMIKERKEQITKPLMEALTSARDLFKPIEQNHAEAEKVVKGKMLDWQDAEEKRIAVKKAKIVEKVETGKIKVETGIKKMEDVGHVQTSTQGKVGAVATRTIKKYRVVDETKIPREYLVPDMKKITDALKAGKEVPGAEAYDEKVIASSNILSSHHPLLGQ